MFWILRKLFWIGVLVAIIYYGSNYQIDGKPIKQYAIEFFQSPLVQSALKAGKEEVQEFWGEKMDSSTPSEGPSVKDSGQASPAGDELTDKDREALDKVLERQSQ